MRLNLDVPSRSAMHARLHRWMAGLGAAGLLFGGLSTSVSVPAAAALAGAPRISADAEAISPHSPAAAEATTRLPVLVRTLDDISEYRLPNGMQVLLVPDASKPVVVVQLTVRAGALRDPAGASGRCISWST